jgi:hypothetical protein
MKNVILVPAELVTFMDSGEKYYSCICQVGDVDGLG